MGVNTKLYLPNSVQPRDVADVAGILAGLPFRWEKFSSGGEGQYVRVAGAQAKGLETVGMCEILLDARHKDVKKFGGKPTLIDGEASHFCYFHFDTEMGMRVITPTSTGFWIAICKGLGEFFGGFLDYQDCDDVPVNETFWEKQNLHWTDEAFDVFQKRQFEVKPLTVDDLIECAGLSAYKNDYSFLCAEV